MSWYEQDDDFGGLDDPFVPRDPDTGDPRPSGEDDADDDADDDAEDDEELEDDEDLDDELGD
jgi:hypothetical protein